MVSLMIEICPLCRHQARFWTRGRFALGSIQCAGCGDYQASRDALSALAQLPQYRIDHCRQFVREAKAKQGLTPRFVMQPGLTRALVKI